jgi:hypothetical protein
MPVFKGFGFKWRNFLIDLVFYHALGRSAFITFPAGYGGAWKKALF